MKNNLTLSVLVFVALILIETNGVALAQNNVNWKVPDISANNINFDQILGKLPAPITDLINSAKQINETLTYRGNNFSISALNPLNILDVVNNWFTGVTGISLISIIKFVGNLFVWALSLAIKFINWILSLI